MSSPVLTPAHVAAVDICNRFATMYVDVHCEAGPWGTKHLDDVTEIIQVAIDESVTLACNNWEMKVSKLKAEIERLGGSIDNIK